MDNVRIKQSFAPFPVDQVITACTSYLESAVSNRKYLAAYLYNTFFVKKNLTLWNRINLLIKENDIRFLTCTKEEAIVILRAGSLTNTEVEKYVDSVYPVRQIESLLELAKAKKKSLGTKYSVDQNSWVHLNTFHATILYSDLFGN